MPSFKNKKRVARRRNGPSFLMTKKEVKQWMDICKAGLEFQLRSVIPTTDAATQMVLSAQSLIALFVPQDDCWQQIPELHVTACRVSDGTEGATITIERIE